MLTNRWLWLAVLFLIRITLGFQFQSVGSVSPQLRADLGIGHAEIGTLIGLYMLPGVVIALPSGLLIKRFGDMRAVGYGLLLMIFGAIFLGLSESFTLAILGRIVSGTGLVLLNVALTKMVIDWFAGREIRTAMGVMLASWPFGIALGLVTQGALADAYSWQFVMFLTGAASAAALIPLLFLARMAPSSAGVEKNVALYTLTRRELLLVSLAGIAWGAFNAGFAIYISFTPGLLIADGFSATDAAALVSIGVWITMISVPIGGFLTEHFGRPQTSIVMFSLLIAITLGLFPYLAIPAVLAVLFGLWMGPPAGALVALTSEALSEDNRGPGLGVFYTWYYLAMAIGPAIAGAGRSATGSSSTPLIFGAALFASIILFASLFSLFAARQRLSAE